MYSPVMIYSRKFMLAASITTKMLSLSRMISNTIQDIQNSQKKYNHAVAITPTMAP